MAVTELFVEGFKALHQVHLQLRPGLVVLVGPNEAGKTTLTEFVRYVLFGVERGRPVDPLAGGQLGGRLSLDLPSGAALLERMGKYPAELRLADGRRLVGPDATAVALGPVDRAMYDAVWSFSLDGLRDFNSLGDADLRNRLFSGALAGEGVSVAGALERLARAMEPLWRERKDARLREEEKRRDLLQRQLEQARVEAEGARALRRQIEEAEQAIRGIAPQLVDCRRQMARLEALIGAVGHQAALSAAERGLELLPVVKPVPGGEVEAIEQLRRALPGLEAGQASLEEHRGRLGEGLQQDPRHARWLAHADDIEVLHGRLGLLDQRSGHLTQVESARRRLGEALQEAGLRDEAELRGLNLDPAHLGRLTEAAVQARSAEESQARRAVKEQEAGRLRAAWQAAQAERNAAPRDRPAAEVEGRVRRLCEELPAIRVAEDEGEEHGRLAEQAGREVSNLEARWGLALARSTVDPEARQRWASRWAAWSKGRQALSVRIESARDELARREEELARAQAVVVGEPDAGRVAAELGAPWDAAAVRRARADQQTLLDLRRLAGEAVHRSRAARDAEESAQIAQQALERLRQAVGGLVSGDWLSEAARQGLSERQVRLQQADAALRRRDEARARGGQDHGWRRWAVIGLGLLVALLGAAVGLGGQALIGVVLALLGLGVAGAGWVWLAPVAGVDPGPVQAEAEGALRQAGLAANVGPAAIIEAQSEVSKAVTALDQARALHERVVASQQAREVAQRAVAALRASLRQAGWPEALSPEAVEPALVSLHAFVLAQAQAEQARREATSRVEQAEQAVQRERAQVAGLSEQLRAAEGPDDHEGPPATLQAPSARTSASPLGEPSSAGPSSAGPSSAGPSSASLRREAADLGAPGEVGLEDVDRWLGDALRRREQVAHRDLAAQAHDRAARRVAAWRQAWAEVLRVLSVEGDPDPATLLRRCELALQRERAWQALDEQVSRRAQAVEQAEVELAALSSHDLAPAWDAWRRALAGVGLPESRSPHEVDVTLLRTAGTRRQELQDAEDGLRAVDGQLAALHAEAVGLADRLEQAPPEPAQLRVWVKAQIEAVGQARRAQQQEVENAELLADLDRERADKARRLDTHRAELRSRLTALGCADLDALAARLHAWRDLEAARQARQEALGRRDAALRVYATDPAILDALREPDEPSWRTALEDLQRLEGGLEQQRDNLLRDKTQREEELRRREEAHDVARLSLELQEVEASLQRSRRQVARLWLARQLLERTQERFRDAHQPTILREASRLLEVATAGVYMRVEADEDGDDLQIIDRVGGRRGTAQLSRGTAELLYLVLRLGLTRDQVSRGQGAALPVVMDDVLVNLDPERTAQVAKLIAEVARRQQVILLTCRPDTEQALLLACPDAQVVKLARYGGRELPPGGVVQRTRHTEGRAPAVRGEASLSSACAALLEVIGRHPEGLGKALLLRESSVAEMEWDRSIRWLVDEKRVVQEGRKKGAVYRLASANSGAEESD